jgi:hypothetical protein
MTDAKSGAKKTTGAAKAADAPAPGARPVEAWNEVGEQLFALGEALAGAFRATVTDPENRRRAQALREDLEHVMTRVADAIKEGPASEQAARVRERAEEAAGSIRQAGEKTAEEVKPHLVLALKQVNQALEGVAARLEKEAGAKAGPAKKAAAKPRKTSAGKDSAKK